MPVIRMSTDDDDAENFSSGSASFGSRDVTRVTNNLKLSEHLGQFVAGQVAGQFQNENLAEMIKGKNMIMVSASWG